jgi:hypothetical protein
MTRRTAGRRGGLPAILAMVLLGSALWGATARAQTPGCVPIAQNKLRLRKVGDAGTGNERILFRGVFDVDPAVTLDPVTTGLEFQMLDSAAGALIDVTLPGVRFDVGGFGWLANASGTVWNWRDRDAHVSGIKRLVLKRHASSSARISLFGQNLDFPLPTLPITIRVLLPGAGGTAGTCGEQVFPDTECFFRNQGNKLICRSHGGRRPIGG